MRTERRLFLAEGPNALEGALSAPERLVEVFATTAAAERHAALLAGLPDGVAVRLIDDRAAATLSDAVTPPGLVAVCRTVDVGLVDVLEARPRLLALCADMRDPGNAGTVLRCADAAGADAVVLLGDSVDVHNPKTVRASAGSLFHLPVAIARDAAEALRAVRTAGMRVLAADGGGSVDLYAAEGGGLLNGATAWLFGNEAAGLDRDLRAAADEVVSIPLHGRAESLNLATAAAVCLYASARVHHRG